MRIAPAAWSRARDASRTTRRVSRDPRRLAAAVVAREGGRRRSRPPRRRRAPRLLEFDRGSGLLEFLLELLGLVAVDTLLDGVGRLVDQRLASLSPRPVAERTTLMTWIFLSPVAVRTTFTVLGPSSSAPALVAAGSVASSGRNGRRDGGGGNAELLLERLDALGELSTEMPLSSSIHSSGGSSSLAMIPVLLAVVVSGRLSRIRAVSAWGRLLRLRLVCRPPAPDSASAARAPARCLAASASGCVPRASAVAAASSLGACDRLARLRRRVASGSRRLRSRAGLGGGLRPPSAAAPLLCSSARAPGRARPRVR